MIASRFGLMSEATILHVGARSNIGRVALPKSAAIFDDLLRFDNPATIHRFKQQLTPGIEPSVFLIVVLGVLQKYGVHTGAKLADFTLGTQHAAELLCLDVTEIQKRFCKVARKPSVDLVSQKHWITSEILSNPDSDTDTSTSG